MGEPSALHTNVRGGDHREGPDDIEVAGLGARLERAPDAGGYRIDYIYQSDSDLPDLRSPLADLLLGLGKRPTESMILCFGGSNLSDSANRDVGGWGPFALGLQVRWR